MIAIVSLVLVFLKKVIRPSDPRTLGYNLFQTDDSAATAMTRLGTRSCLLRARRAEDVGIVRSFRVLRNNGFFTRTMHIPAPLAFRAIAAEFFGGLGLILELLTRIAAFGIAVNMVVAIATVHKAFDFFMNWDGTQQGEASNITC